MWCKKFIYLLIINKLLKDIDLAYLAGVYDSDGSIGFSISLRNDSILINPNVKIGWDAKYDKTLIKLKNMYNIGKIYYSNKNKINQIVSWQIIGFSESIKFCELILPYLTIKKDRCEKFINICKFWISTMNMIGGKRGKGTKLRTQSDMKKIVKIAVTMNESRQTGRWREHRGVDYWFPIIEKLYPLELNK